MRWAIKHKSGRTLFVTSDEFIANNRRKMGWIVEEVKMTSREQFEGWIKEETGFDLWRTEYPMTECDDQQYKMPSNKSCMDGVAGISRGN